MDQHEPSEVLEGLDAPAELESWFEASLAPRLARAVRLGLVDERQAVALEVDVRSLIGGERPAGLAQVPRRARVSLDEGRAR